MYVRTECVCLVHLGGEELLVVEIRKAKKKKATGISRLILDQIRSDQQLLIRNSFLTSQPAR